MTEDVIAISRYTRTVARVLLLGTVDILNEGYRIAKQKRKSQRRNTETDNHESDRGEQDNDDDEENNFGRVSHTNLKRARLKVEYYAAWCVTHWEDVVEHVVADLAQWKEDWTLPTKKQVGDTRLLSVEEQEKERMFVVEATTTGFGDNDRGGGGDYNVNYINLEDTNFITVSL